MPSLKDTKKRQAVSQSGPKSKKPFLDKHSSNDKTKKRSRPVTLPKEQNSDVTSDEEDFDEVENGAPGGLDDDDEVDEGAGPSNPSKVVDPNAARESHKAQKLLFEQRRAAKPHSALLVDAKKAWSLARQKNISKDERTKYIHDLMEIVRGNVKDIVFKHDASRIVQTVVKYGSAKERNEIAVELKGKYQALAQNKYSKFLVTKLIRLCPSHRASILTEFQGNVRRLLLHREASSVLADAFELYANAYERSILLKDFYGKEASLFTVTMGSDEEKEKSKKGLKGILEGADKERRKRVMSSVKENLVTIFNNPDKGAVSHAIVHRILWEYLCTINDIEDEAEREKLRREMFEICQDVIAEMVHTKDGSRSVREFIVQGSAKDRKHIVKAIKPHVERMCIDDEAQLVLFTALDVIDDTKLTAKSLVSDIVGSASTLYTTPQGRRSLIYLVLPRTRRHFTPAQIALLSETDVIRAQTSKKDNTVRSEEICRAASEPLLTWISKNGPEIVRDPGGSLVVTEVMLYSEGDKAATMESILKPLASTFPSTDPANPHLLSLPHASRMYKTLLQGGHFSKATNAIDKSPLFSSSDFAKKFIEIVGKDVITSMAKEDGVFVTAALCESIIAAGEDASESRKVLKEWLSGLKKELGKDTEQRGRTTLLEQLANL
ncbi:ARM repeat-containing protein [Abortiporus biennis]|nr:ARM repeat-containing protein [Abortiporus biennis]